MKTYPDRAEAERLVREAEACNPGPWGDHSRVVGQCAEKIACCCDMNPEKAYILGLLHDIGRKFGVKHLAHVCDGYRYMMELGYPDAARICLTHSFSVKKLEDYIGRWDISAEQQEELRRYLEAVVYDDYDRLIQLCDSLVGAGVIMDMESRMTDVKTRYGFYPQEKWDANLALKSYFEEKSGKDIYDIIGKMQNN